MHLYSDDNHYQTDLHGLVFYSARNNNIPNPTAKYLATWMKSPETRL